MRDTGIELRRFLDEAETGAYDLPPMQRALCIRPAFPAGSPPSRTTTASGARAAV